MPRKLKSILRKINKELQKYASKDSTMNPHKIDEMRKILTSDRNMSWEMICDALEGIIVSYYRNVDGEDARSERFVRGLREICAAQNRCGESAMLDLCEEEGTMERLAVNCELVESEWSCWDGAATGGKCNRDATKQRVEEVVKAGCCPPSLLATSRRPIEDKSGGIEGKIETEMSRKAEKGEIEKEENDVLDFDNFQLVDVWEEKNEETGGDKEKSDSQKKETKSARRKRRSRFGPLSEEAMFLLMQPRTFGFCSTFVDEEAVAGDKLAGSATQEASKEPSSEVVIDEAEKHAVSIDFSAKMFDVVAPTDEVNLVAEEEEEEEKHEEEHEEEPEEIGSLQEDKGELCKAMLRKFHDSLRQAIEGANQSSGGWQETAASISACWGRRGTVPGTAARESGEVESACKEAFDAVENKMNVLMRDYFNRSNLRRKPARPAAVLAACEKQLSPSPTPFDQSIEASMKKTRAVPPAVARPVVARRPTRSDGQASPEKARLRAMMLSYKRDIVKSREVGDKREESQIDAGQGSDECGMADLVLKTAQSDESNYSEEAKSKLKEEILPAPDESQKSHSAKSERVILKSHSKKQENVSVANTDSEGLVTSSDDEDSSNRRRREAKHKMITTSTPRENRVEKNRMQWLIPPPEAVSLAPIPAPATPFLDDEGQSWTGRKVFVVDSHDKGSAIALMVKAFLQKNGARVYDTTNYKQAGKDLHVLVHQDWRFPDSSSRGDKSLPSSLVSLLMLKNNAGVHFLSYTDVETVSRFSCQTVFPHSRSCIFLDQHALTSTQAENIRNMLDFMIAERQTSNRIWCLKIPGSVHKHFCAQISENSPDTDVANLKEIQSILTEYSTKYTHEDSLCLVEIQTGDEDITNQQDHVLNQQYYLQKKFRHFCILTDNLSSDIELDIGFLSTNGVAVLSLNTFLTNKTGKYIKKTLPS